MHVTRNIAATAAAGSLLLAIGITPASAADTTTTFSLTSGALSVTAPTSADLGSGDVASADVSAVLGTVQVDDQRGDLTASWTVTASSTAFTTGTATADETIAAAAITYEPGTPTIISGTPTLTPAISVSDLSTAKTVMEATAVGENAASWTPTITIAIPGGAVAGTYSGTLTHSVS